ncbi:MAG TPA: DUF3566 domain-containing protein [Segeticoccus sp.]|uniref:DUF3566 domain-containing protein n=1 Tax=Segeticoccus sp. TaxID=2706531 RepID=UPI002D7FD5F6|nr:DUF3566 domain-containing protein [Segeticoccus sp.]HET8600951.1 DUF3566 domain-containing protein [Segeticoccus sp.]
MSTSGQAGTAARSSGETRTVPQQNRPSGRSGAGTGTDQRSPGQSRPGGRSSGGPAPRPRGPRRVRLTVSRCDPWSVMKISFLLSVAIGIAFVVMIAVLWLLLSGMGVFADVNRTVSDIVNNPQSGSAFNIMDYIGFGRVVSLAVVIGVIDVVLMTAISTLGAFLYNICSSLVGGLQVTLSDE